MSFARIACLGGLYSNYLALEKALEDLAGRSVDAVYCLGDLGGFGPYPDRVFPLLRDSGVQCLQGNYDHSIGNGLDDCQCGYLDPRDNWFAQLSYDYTFANTSAANRRFLCQLPGEIRIQLGRHRVLLCHGSPRRVNEFLWQSTTSNHFLAALCDRYNADIIAATHTGIHWFRELPGNRLFANVGVLGRPANDGRTCVWYTIIDGEEAAPRVEFVPVEYDHVRLAREMSEEGLPSGFCETVLTGWWTTCLENLPVKERRAGKF